MNKSQEKAVFSALNLISREKPIMAVLQALPPEAEIYLVGGSVRDSLLGTSTNDFDLATNLPPQILCEHLKKFGIRIIPTGIKHNTLTALCGPDLQQVEITTFRGPESLNIGSLSAINADLELRDFTINAMAYDLRRQNLIDPTGGLYDLEHKIIRTCGEAHQRFSEDPLRLLRLVRFASWEGFSLEETSRNAAAFCAPLLARVSIERIREEFNRILLGARAAYGLQLLLDLKLLEQFLPEVAAFCGFEQNRFHHLDLFKHTLAVVDKTPPDLLLRLAALLHDVGKPNTLSVDENGDRHFFCHESIGADIARGMMERLRYSRQETGDVERLIRTHMRPLNAGPSGLRRLLRDTDGLFERWRELKKADSLSVLLDPAAVASELAAFDKAIEQVKLEPNVSPFKNLALNGKDLIQLGLRPGPQFGHILRALHEKVLDEPTMNCREILLPLAREIALELEVKGIKQEEV